MQFHMVSAVLWLFLLFDRITEMLVVDANQTSPLLKSKVLVISHVYWHNNQ